jgi:hypothetical protein
MPPRQKIKEEREKWSNIICYHHIMVPNAKCVYKAINNSLYVITPTPSIPRDRSQIFFRNLVREEGAGLVSLPIFLN